MRATRHERRATRISGFTLIELLLVLVLISISVAAIIPRLGTRSKAWRAREDAKNIRSAVRFARSAAVRDQQIVIFVVDANNGSFAVERFNESDKSSDAAKALLVPKQLLGNDVLCSDLEGFERIGEQQRLIFWPDGRTKKASIELTIAQQGKSNKWRISIENDGYVALQEVLKK